MTRTMYDSITAADIPLTAPMVAGYCDGLYVWDGPSWGRFGGVTRVRIAVIATTNDGHVLDVETGAATPAEAPGWVTRRRAAGTDPTVYVNRSNWSAVQQAFAAAGVAQPHYWLAAYDGIAQLPAGCVAKQYANSAISGGHYDLSIVADFWPGVDDMRTIDELYTYLESVYSSLDSATKVLAANLATLEAQVGAIKAQLDALPATQPSKPLTITLTGTAL